MSLLKLENKLDKELYHKKHRDKNKLIMLFSKRKYRKLILNKN
jgi:hypothetical protein